MTYQFKWLPELGFAALVAASTALLQALTEFDPALVTDWRLWAVALGAGVVRATAAGLIVGMARATGRR